MELTVKELIEKLEKVENKNKSVFFETVDSFLSVDLVFIDEDEDIIFSNVTELDDETRNQCKEI
ncbi:hypothetical protein KMD04_gp09 [Lactococcus phage CHPC1242]|jgi:hypothetical protein|uniref:Uncharacterized protein n=2 Tax=Ceduovirus TaxID=186532 RepID=A0A650ERC9_9CAUD|nr:hypothetical protein KMD01_gp13 [Lactococcus phage CHPC1170]YP_010081422.1 hypothetical protein KMD04_gp09 [Lactococcus phage CHPC1242]QGT52537.1 hypothetical protein CHPC1170_000191 [Lactococcus phage CHPC1170]QGT52740.1 hypothetical protein CHPC1242_000394 [Lactococcus phage CHPC1242]